MRGEGATFTSSSSEGVADGAYAGPMQPVSVTRYVTPLREGGSLPGLMEADDLGMYVVKFHAAGQGPKALVAEIICAELAARIGLAVPRLVLIDVPTQLAPAEPDEEVQHLLRASAGVNLGVDFLPGALDVGAMPAIAPDLAGFGYSEAPKGWEYSTRTWLRQIV